MSFLDVLAQYAQQPAESGSRTSESHYDEIAPQLSPQALQSGMADTFRSSRTPPFGDMVSRLFDQSSSQQRAGLLTQLVQSLGPAAASVLGSGVLGRMFGSHSAAPGASAPSITPAQADQVSTDEVRDIATRAEAQHPAIVDTASAFFAQHPDLIKGIGAMGLAVLLGKMARR